MDISSKKNFLKKYRTNEDELILLDEMKQSEYTSERRESIREQQKEIENILNTIQDDRERMILQRKYYFGENNETIAEKLHYSKSQIARLYKQAIENLEIQNDS